MNGYCRPRRRQLIRQPQQVVRGAAQELGGLGWIMELLGGEFCLIPPLALRKRPSRIFPQLLNGRAVIPPVDKFLLRQSRRLSGKEDPPGVGGGLLLVLLRLFLGPPFGSGLAVVSLLLPQRLGLAAHPAARRILRLRPFTFQAALLPAAHFPRAALQIMPQEAVPAPAVLSIRAFHIRLPPPALLVLPQDDLRRVAGEVRIDRRQPLLHILRQPGQGVGRLLRQFVLLEQQQELRGFQFLPDDLQPSQLRRGDLAGRRHLIPHPPRELVPLLLELVQQDLHPLRLLGDLRVGQHPGGAVGKDQLELRHGLAPVLAHGTGHRPQILPAILRQQPNGGAAPVAGEQQILSFLVRVRHHHRVLLEPVHGDGIRQRLQRLLVHLVEIGLVVQDVLQRDHPDFRRGNCVQLGHRFHHGGEIELLTLAHSLSPSPDIP